jgi:chromosome condensin MukBEF ATPase and DNA-binding subunit MukB
MINFILNKIGIKYITLGLVILVVLMSLLYQVEKTRHRLTAQEFEAFKYSMEMLAKENEMTIKTLGTIYNKQIQNHEAEHKAAVDKLNLDRNKLRKDLQNEVNRYNSLITFSKLRQNNTSNSGVSKNESATSLPTEVGRNSNSTIVDACRLTTLDYNALYDAWMIQCDIYGCE